MNRGSFLSVLLLGCFYNLEGNGIFVEQPGPVDEILGESLLIPCVTQTPHDFVQWRQDGDGGTVVGDSERGVINSYKQYYELEFGGTPRTDFTIKIKSVRLNEPQLRCEVEIPGSALQKSSLSAITCIAPPYKDFPKCSASPDPTIAGEEITLTCNSAGGKEAAALKWKQGDNILNEGPGEEGTDFNSRGTRKLEQTFNVEQGHNGIQFTCTAENTAITKQHERDNSSPDQWICTTELDVKWPPEETTITPADSYIILEKEDLTVTCGGSGGNPDEYQYRFRQLDSWSGWAAPTQRVYNGIRWGKRGQYGCQSRNTFGGNLFGDGPEKTFDLDIHYSPEITITKSQSSRDVGAKYDLDEGDSLSLVCTADANPPALLYRWTKQGGGFTPRDDANLGIDSVDKSTAGTYNCTVQNEMTPSGRPRITGTGSGAVIINVYYAPYKVTISSNNVSKKENANQEDITCSSDCNPECTFRWLFRSSPNADETEVSDTATLSLGQLKRDEHGTYTCEAKNRLDTMPASIDVTVYYEPVVDSFTIVGGSEPGKSVNFTCEADSRPLSSLKLLNGTKELASVKDTKTLKYTIHNSDCLHSGNFQCVASNTVYDTSATKDKTLTAHCAPRVYKKSPDSLKAATEKGKPVPPLSVEVIAHPYPSFKWKRVGDNTELPSSGFDVTNAGLNSTLNIHNITLDQLGDYMVIATNRHGNDNVTFTVSLRDKPDPPVMTLTVTAVSLTIRWKRGWDGGLAQTFYLTYLGKTEEFTDEGDHYLVRLDEDDGIKEDTEYTVKLYAENSKGVRDTVIQTVRTKAKPIVDDEGTKVIVHNNNNTAIITWNIDNQKSFTRIMVKVCVVGNTDKCLEHNITDISSPSVIDIPAGMGHDFSFLLYDGADLVSSHAKQVVEGKDESIGLGPVIGGVVGVIVILFIVIIVLIFLIRRKRSRGAGDEEKAGKREQKRSGFFRKKLERFRVAGDRKKNVQSKTTIYERTNPTYVNEHMSEPEYAQLSPGNKSEQTEIVYEEVDPKNCECTLDAVELGSLVHEGVFFKELNGTIQRLSGFRRGTRVIVKLSREEASVFEQSMLVADIKALKVVGQHANVVHLLAQSIHKEPIMAILACEENGDLRNYFQRMKDKLSVDVRKQYILTKMIQDVINGMDYLAQLEMRILHHRVSADHVLVSREGLCRVSGFGFATDILEREEYERSQGIEEAVRWMAPEQIKHHEHTRMSDVWSCGVLMWEVFNYGAEPYSDMTINEARQCIVSGGMLGCPEDASDNIYDLMRKCWETSPGRRPELSSLMRMFNRQTA